MTADDEFSANTEDEEQTPGTKPPIQVIRDYEKPFEVSILFRNGHQDHYMMTKFEPEYSRGKMVAAEWAQDSVFPGATLLQYLDFSEVVRVWTAASS